MPQAGTLEPRIVPPKRKPDNQTDRVSLKLNRELMRKASAVADFKGIDRQDYLEEVLRPLIEADYREFLKRESESAE